MNYIVYFVTDTSVNTGTLCHYTATAIPFSNDTTPLNNTAILVNEVVGSYDPNCKEVEPSGNTPLSFVQNQDWLDYTIHFQNIGTAPAVNVYVYDELDANLDIGSFEFIASSHPCTFNMSGKGFTTFTFSSINLPSIVQDEPLSHGFVRYRVKPDASLTAGDKILNNAYIFFDFNQPIVTNTVVMNVVTVLSAEFISNDESTAIRLFPNPAENIITV